MKIKDTIHLGKTDFSLRAGLAQSEPVSLKNWEENQLYQKRLDLNANKQHFNLHDGPPYANGNIHIGHALNKISKDMIIRYKNMNGFFAPYIPGWDTHGLPIEQQLTKAGHNRKELSVVEWRKLANQFALEQVATQKQDFKRLGVLADWDHPYLTLQPVFEAAQLRVFAAMVRNNLIYRGAKPIFWSWSSESALAEAEIEYHDLESKTAYYSNPVIDGQGVLEAGDNLIVWTTTPWTIPGSRGIAVGPNIDYVLVSVEDNRFVVAEQLLTSLAEQFNWNDYQVIKRFKGQEIDRVTAEHPFNPEIELLVINGDHVTTESGTGLVHTAPGFGEDDYLVGKKYDLEIAAPIDNQGKLTVEAGADFDGVFYQKADDISLNKLKEKGLLIDQVNLTHSYPFDWRTKKPIIWRAIPQWFASIQEIRDDILDQIDQIKFTPEWGQKRLHNMIADRGDWVISRQRAWGVPLPIFYGEDGQAIVDADLIEHLADLVEEQGSDIWWQLPADQLLPAGYQNQHSPNNKFEKETDIMDVWFDSGTSWNGVLNQRQELDYPADLVLEGSDQYRGWFNSSLITSVAVNQVAPYKQLISQGFVLDGNGDKMSKSLGNTINPNQIADSLGIDILRLWVLSSDYDNDVRISDEILNQVAESYRKIRNTLRFLLANTSDFNPLENAVDFDQLESVDFYIVAKFNDFAIEWKKMFEEYRFKDMYQSLVNFVNVDLSSFYLDIAKDIVYIKGRDSNQRRSMQTAFYHILRSLILLLVPIIPFTAEEAWSYLEFEAQKDFAYLNDLPDFEKLTNDNLEMVWQRFFGLRDVANKSLEEARSVELIGKNAEAKLLIEITNQDKQLFDEAQIDLRQLLMVSQLIVKTSEVDQPLVVVEHADGEVDPRDRLYHDDIGADSDFPMLSAENAAIVKADFPQASVEGLE